MSIASEEIAASSAAYDLHDKLHVYRRNEVQEYIIWTMYPRRVEWLRLEEGVYVPLTAGEDGIIRSKIYPGLWLDREALLAEKVTGVLTGLQRSLTTAEHAGFVTQLGAHASSTKTQS